MKKKKHAKRSRRAARYILSLVSIPIETAWLVCVCTLVSPTLSGEQATVGMWVAGALLCVTAILNCWGTGRRRG
ncbi:hypothetical protein AALA00_12185 [Lachnospiraceae bacterium 46-15]